MSVDIYQNKLCYSWTFNVYKLVFLLSNFMVKLKEQKVFLNEFYFLYVIFVKKGQVCLKCFYVKQIHI